ncbi:MAG: 5'-nucleotidase [Candidatus Accumulibacter appositus]|uniref:5'-nucleotidase n=1 Tax=Candidatus Accumulibacter appositus TaxID=1454003 RepID=A0A011QII8_9PROT|nr:HAD hydrolase-like protein [Accumulibacter sp.]EXI78664.1 MAG: 5'-nucleotidase [Candidatus Accumulibacter appositus]HRF03326.1 HAD hydrolase-like protein [Accumulibacter sp.]
MFQAIIFDLDGTLIDSRAAILDAFGKALAEKGIAPRIALSAVRIGPPLAETLRELSGSDDEALLESLAEHFKAHYDSSGYRASEVFAGIPELLEALAENGRRCFLATNKRIVPTRLILQYLQWEPYFEEVYALDRETPRLPDKRSMLARLLAEQALDAQNCIYVGDTPEDEAAARANALRFTAVSWGYGQFPNADRLLFSTPRELGTFLCQGENAR